LNREDLAELHYITPIENVPSIMASGILSNKLTKKIGHKSCASQDIQERRAKVILPNGKPLHDYVNLYFNARNPMMHLLKDNHYELAVLAIDPNILDTSGVIVSDQNASREYALFKPAPDGLEMIDKNLIFAEFWTHPDPIKHYEHKGIMCAEILVPNKIDAGFVLRAYVSSDQSHGVLLAMVTSVMLNLDVIINSHLFFH